MMGRLKSDQGQLFYEFRLDDAVPEDHLVRRINAALDLSRAKRRHLRRVRRCFSEGADAIRNLVKSASASVAVSAAEARRF
jgi:hypothetical protein